MGTPPYQPYNGYPSYYDDEYYVSYKLDNVKKSDKRRFLPL
jgi:hypothetical protein